MTRPRPRRLALLSLLVALTGCSDPEPDLSNATIVHTPKGLARELSFRVRGIAKGVPGASTGGPARAPGGPTDGRTIEQVTEEKMLGDIAEKLRSIKGSTPTAAYDQLMDEVARDPDLTDEQKARVGDQLKAMLQAP